MPALVKGRGMPPRAEKVELRICVAGEAGVGKTSLIHRFVYDSFDDRYVVTLGAKVSSREFPVRVGGKAYIAALSIWDIMGNGAFREILKDAVFAGAQGILAVCDVTRPETLEGLRQWIQTVEEVAGPVPVYVLANKTDLVGRKRVGEAELRAFCGHKGWEFALTSAKTGENVEAAFRRLTEIYLSRNPRGGRRTGKTAMPLVASP